jgi:hypothetical protein
MGLMREKTISMIMEGREVRVDNPYKPIISASDLRGLLQEWNKGTSRHFSSGNNCFDFQN